MNVYGLDFFKQIKNKKLMITIWSLNNQILRYII